MLRENPRTLRSMLPVLQKSVSGDEYGSIVIDNGSAHALSLDGLETFGVGVRLGRIEPERAPRPIRRSAKQRHDARAGTANPGCFTKSKEEYRLATGEDYTLPRFDFDVDTGLDIQRKSVIDKWYFG